MMTREVGNKGFPIWLLGDSNPEQWQNSLKTPLDPRHPIRHNIWTSVLDVIQDKVFRESRGRVDSSAVYIRNAVDDPTKKPHAASVEWGEITQREVEAFKRLARTHKPILVLCFGAFSFEFARRALEELPQRGFGHWGAKRLGEEFRHRVGQFNPNITNALPLLHRSIAGGKFIKSHDYFCGQKDANYFEHVGQNIAGILLRHRDSLLVWVV